MSLLVSNELRLLHSSLDYLIAGQHVSLAGVSLLVSNELLLLLLHSSLDYLIAGQQFSLAGVSLLVSNDLLLHSSLDIC